MQKQISFVHPHFTVWGFLRRRKEPQAWSHHSPKTEIEEGYICSAFCSDWDQCDVPNLILDGAATPKQIVLFSGFYNTLSVQKRCAKNKYIKVHWSAYFSSKYIEKHWNVCVYAKCLHKIWLKWVQWDKSDRRGRKTPMAKCQQDQNGVKWAPTPVSFYSLHISFKISTALCSRSENNIPSTMDCCPMTSLDLCFCF